MNVLANQLNAKPCQKNQLVLQANAKLVKLSKLPNQTNAAQNGNASVNQLKLIIPAHIKMKMALPTPLVLMSMSTSQDQCKNVKSVLVNLKVKMLNLNVKTFQKKILVTILKNVN